MSSPNSVDIVYAYRHLYKGLLQAVRYSKPARFVARNQLRDAFRKGDPSTFNQRKIDRTVEFLTLARQFRGIEHRVLRNLLHINYWSRKNDHYIMRKARTPVQKELLAASKVHYNMTIAMLNDSMGLCLR